MPPASAAIEPDIARRVSQLHRAELETGEVAALQLKREKFLEHFSNRSSRLIGPEACGGSQHWVPGQRHQSAEGGRC